MPTKLLIFCFGDSVHARRRVKIFVDDPSFEVAVISDYDYGFENAKNLHLKPLHGKKDDSIWWRKYTLTKYLVFAISEIIAICYNLWTVKKFVRGFKPNVILLQTLIYPSYLAFIASKKIPIAITFWNGDVTWWAKWSGLEMLFKKQILHYGIKRAKLLTANSQTAYQAAVKYGADTQKMKLLQYPAVDIDHFRKLDKNQAKKLLQIELSQKVIFCPRGFALKHYLNNETILEASKSIIKENENILFLFSNTCNQDEWEIEMQKMEKIGISKKHFRFDGKIEHSKMPFYYAASEMVLSISSNDSLPNVMLEAMACGVPLIMGDIPPIKEIIQDQQNGFVIGVHDSKALISAIREVLNQNLLIQVFIEKNRLFIEKYMDSKKNSQIIKDLIKNLCP